jgi:hypothetical protein
LCVPGEQVEALRGAWDHAKLSAGEYSDVWWSVHKELLYLPSRGRYERAASATNTERLEAIKASGRGWGKAWSRRDGADGVALSGLVERSWGSVLAVCRRCAGLHRRGFKADFNSPPLPCVQAQSEFDSVRLQMQREAARAQKLEKKLEVGRQ